MSETEATLQRITSHPSVVEVLLTSSDHRPLRKCKILSDEATKQWSEHLSQLCFRARSLVREIEPQNDLLFANLCCKSHEIMIAPDNAFTLMVVQKTGSSQISKETPLSGTE